MCFVCFRVVFVVFWFIVLFLSFFGVYVFFCICTYLFSSFYGLSYLFIGFWFIFVSCVFIRNIFYHFFWFIIFFTIYVFQSFSHLFLLFVWFIVFVLSFFGLSYFYRCLDKLFTTVYMSIKLLFGSHQLTTNKKLLKWWAQPQMCANTSPPPLPYIIFGCNPKNA